MAEIELIFSSADIAELVAKAATLQVDKAGLTANPGDVAFQVETCTRIEARVRIRNISPR